MLSAGFPVAAAGLRTGARFARRSAGEKAAEKVAIMHKASDPSALVERGASKTAAERAATGAQKASVVQGATGVKVTIRDLIDEMASSAKRKFRSDIPQNERTQLARDLRDRIRQVARESTMGTVDGRKLVFTADEADLLKQEFATLGKRGYEAAARGVRPRPDFDRAIADAWRSALDKKVAGLREANAANKGAIKRDMRMQRRRESLPTEEERAIDLERKQGMARAAVEMPEGGSLSFHTGFRPGGVGVPGLAINPPRGSAMMDMGAGALEHPLMRLLAQLPRGFAAREAVLDAINNERGPQ
jgi:hypothetical protein